MLDRSRFMKEVIRVEERLFFDASSEYEYIRILWDILRNDTAFIDTVKNADASLMLPTWQDEIYQSNSILPDNFNYTTLAVDGSQIYPDRHEGTACFLVNVGSVLFKYGKSDAHVQLHSVPYLFVGDEDPLMQGSAIDYVNCAREALEFNQAVSQAHLLSNDDPMLLLFDGSLIFWHLETKDYELRMSFLRKYCTLLFALYEMRIPYASYISLPRNKDVVRLMNFAAQYHREAIGNDILLEHVNDADVMRHILPAYSYSTVFKHTAKIIEQYPEPIRPVFVYLNVGSEIARVEVPAWVANDKELLEMSLRIILNQSIKGNGYPIAIAEAHEQAVVKGPDREFFYHVIRKTAFDNQHCMCISQKSLKKRRVGI